MSKTMRTPIPFFHIIYHRRWHHLWWKDIAEWIAWGWWWDVRTYWQRARYGWSPSDVWSLDTHLAKVMGETLDYLLTHGYGVPGTYPYADARVKDNVTGEIREYIDSDDPNDIICDHDQWAFDLARWSAAFREYVADDLYAKFPGEEEFRERFKEEERRNKAVCDVLKELAPWFGALWI